MSTSGHHGPLPRFRSEYHKIYCLFLIAYSLFLILLPHYFLRRPQAIFVMCDFNYLFDIFWYQISTSMRKRSNRCGYFIPENSK